MSDAPPLRTYKTKARITYCGLGEVDGSLVMNYWLDNYGTCRSEPCECRKPGNPWLGCACANWQPLGATSFEELKAMVLGDEAPRQQATGAP